MSVFLITETTKPSRRFRIIKIFDNAEEATKCYDYYSSFFCEDSPYQIDIVEWEISEIWSVNDH